MFSKKPTLLVVDDVIDNIDILREALGEEYTVRVATNGPAALESVKKSLPDLILLDVMMPGMDGFEVCRKLKSDSAAWEIPIIFITALNETKEKIEGFSAGGVDYVTKPFHFEEVRARVETHLRLRRMQIELKALSDMKNHFLGMAAHDLRNPLGGIIGISEILVEELSLFLNEKQAEMFDLINSSGNLMLQMINDLLDISVIESGQLNIEKQDVDITALIKRSVEINRVFASKKNMRINISSLEQLPQVLADMRRIEQVINNLLSNAIKYSEPGTEITVNTRYENNEVTISVADQGLGIPEKEQHKLFMAFGKTSVQPTGGEQSTGLGLLIVMKIIEAHDGMIWFQSEPGKGSEFFFSLPVTSCDNR